MKYLPGISLLTFLLVSCSGTRDAADSALGTWVGTITTEGNVTTVVNESGSVWGGMATLVEEASIGVEVGEEPSMLADIVSIAASRDRIFLLEANPPVVRVYDMDGRHVRDIGSQGQGPGEFAAPMSMVVDRDGNLLVRDDRNSRLTVLSPEGDLLDSWSLPGGAMTSRDSVATSDGTVYLPQIVGRDPELGRAVFGMVPYDPDGVPGEPLQAPDIGYETPELPEVVSVRPDGGRSIARIPIPLYPMPAAIISPRGAWVVGVGDQYRFEMRHFGGRVVVVERIIDPVPVSAEEAAWHQRRLTVSMRRLDPEWRWSGPSVPDRKPFFDQLHVDQDGRVWVRRTGQSAPVENCDEFLDVDEPRERSGPVTSCWEASPIFEVFGEDGRYLSEVEFPLAVRGFGDPYIRGDMVLLQAQDEAGTTMVKRYRLVLPGDEAPTSNGRPRNGTGR